MQKKTPDELEELLTAAIDIGSRNVDRIRELEEKLLRVHKIVPPTGYVLVDDMKIKLWDKLVRELYPNDDELQKIKATGVFVNVTLRDLELPERAYNALKADGINTLADILAKDDAYLLSIPNFGKVSLRDTREACNYFLTGDKRINVRESR